MQIISALFLDALLGDPKKMPHPVILVGAVVNFWEKIFYKIKDKRLGGNIFCLSVLFTTGLWVFGFLHIFTFNSYVRAAVEIYLIYSAIAWRSLKDESLPVALCLYRGDIPQAREELSYIVGRDTDNMDKKEIIKATVETIGENYIDGVFSVLFYALLGGFFGHAAMFAWLFKAASTMDSMVGYNDEQYKDFGFAAAKLDDALNFIPARIGGFLAVVAGSFLEYRAGSFNTLKQAMTIFFRDRKNHASPNSACGESAFAGLLGISLGGGAYYEGIYEEKPAIGDDTREPKTSDILKSHAILDASVAASALIIILISFAMSPS